jgi:Methyltransferase FkbM domain
VPAAAADRPGTAAFRTEETGYMGQLHPDGELTVPVVTLDDLAATHQVRADVVKLDVEGGEAEVLRGARRILTEDRPVVFLATHGTEPHARSCAALTELDYELTPLDAPTLADAREVLARPGTAAGRA